MHTRVDTVREALHHWIDRANESSTLTRPIVVREEDLFARTFHAFPAGPDVTFHLGGTFRIDTLKGMPPRMIVRCCPPTVASEDHILHHFAMQHLMDGKCLQLPPFQVIDKKDDGTIRDAFLETGLASLKVVTATSQVADVQHEIDPDNLLVLQSIIRTIKEDINQNGGDYVVFCQQGIDRSPTILACIIMNITQRSAEQVIRWIRTTRPIAFTGKEEYAQFLRANESRILAM